MTNRDAPPNLLTSSEVTAIVARLEFPDLPLSRRQLQLWARDLDAGGFGIGLGKLATRSRQWGRTTTQALRWTRSILALRSASQDESVQIVATFPRAVAEVEHDPRGLLAELWQNSQPMASIFVASYSVRVREKRSLNWLPLHFEKSQKSMRAIVLDAMNALKATCQIADGDKTSLGRGPDCLAGFVALLSRAQTMCPSQCAGSSATPPWLPGSD